MALKNEFDTKSFRVVLVRALIGALLGAIPGTVYVFSTAKNQASSSFGMMLIQTGSMIGAMAFGLAALSGTIVATLKSRGTGPKSNRIKDYLNPETLPAIPPSLKPSNKDEPVSSMQSDPIEHPNTTPGRIDVKPSQVTIPVEPAGFEDFDR